MNRYVYILFDGTIPFYVGKGTHAIGYKSKYQRGQDHLREASLPREEQSNKLKCAYINRLLSEGRSVRFEIIKDNMNDTDAIKLETRLIKTYRRLSDGGTLTNMVVDQKLISHELRRRSVYCFLTTGTLQAKFGSLREAATALNVSPGNIVNCCKNKHRTCAGRVWSYNSEFPGYIAYTAWNSGPVCCYSSTGDLIASFASATEAAKKTGITQSRITSCVREESKTAGGFVWVKQGIPFRQKSRKNPGRKKQKVDQFTLNGRLITQYSSISEAVRSTKLTGIRRCCVGLSNTCGGYIWRYVK